MKKNNHYIKIQRFFYLKKYFGCSFQKSGMTEPDSQEPKANLKLKNKRDSTRLTAKKSPEFGRNSVTPLYAGLQFSNSTGCKKF